MIGDLEHVEDSQVRVSSCLRRVAELEAELSGVKAIVDWTREQNEQLRARIAELGAERDYNRTAHDSATVRIAKLTQLVALFNGWTPPEPAR